MEGDSRLLDKDAKYERLVSNQSVGIKKPKISGNSRPGFCRDLLARILPHKILSGTGPPCGFWRIVIACESGANLCVIDSCSTRLTTNIDHGIFHGIDTCDHRKTRATTGFHRPIYNRMGVAGQNKNVGWAEQREAQQVFMKQHRHAL